MWEFEQLQEANLHLKEQVLAAEKKTGRLSELVKAMEEENRMLKEIVWKETSSEEQSVTDTARKIETFDGVAAGTVYMAEELDIEHLRKYFQAFPIRTDGDVYSRINGKSYRDNPDIALEDLRYLKLLHYNFEHQFQVGELIVNQAIAEEVLEIFWELFQAEYEI